MRDDPCTNVSGVPTGIHFAFTDRLMWRGNMIKRSAETVFPGGIPLRTDVSIQLTFVFALEAPPHHATPRHATPESVPVTKQTARLNWKDFRLRATLYVTIGKRML